MSESVGELAAQLLVLVGEFTVAAQRDVEALTQGGLAGALPGRGRGGVWGLVAGAQTPDLVFEVGLSVEPGAGDALLTELKWTSAHVNGEVAVSGVTVTARDGRW